eukprot:CAMPEP_0171088768 /NCGR_PEP_ID=MMETSP0766_2-20121228/20975_1 /TAXON_ID=439317 /ORGANISM="Gambierdiscus australes, Strain CAWD 149" /LENGTH=299 /DNA_ID=CAMNT_0011546583 /DNA_START=56 /DNA_END=955 /DNA_ORIENTATION=-
MGAYCLRAVSELHEEEEEEEEPSKLIPSMAFTAVPPGDNTPLAEAGENSHTSRRKEQRERSPARDMSSEQSGPAALVQRGNSEAWPLGSTGFQEDHPARARWSRTPSMPVPVTLHIYDIGTSGGGQLINALLRPLGTGVFHCGVEVFGCEWSYSDTTSGVGDGIFSSRPRHCEGHSFCESVSMGRTGTTESEVLQLIEMLKEDWPVSSYDVLAHNCCHFSDEFCQRLGVGSIPSWVMNLAGAGAAVAAAGDTTCCRQVASQVAIHTQCCPKALTASGPVPVEVIDAPHDQPERKAAFAE